MRKVAVGASLKKLLTSAVRGMRTYPWIWGVSATAFVVLAWEGYREADGYQYPYTEKISNYLYNLILGTLTNPSAFWTALASIVGIVVLRYIHRQLRATQQSTDAFVEAERGSIRLLDAHLENINGVRWAYFTMSNLGRGLATVQKIEGSYQVLGGMVEQWDRSKPYHTILEIREAMKQDDLLTCGGDYTTNGGRTRRVETIHTDRVMVDSDVTLRFQMEINKGNNPIIGIIYRTTYSTFNSSYRMIEAVGVDSKGQLAFHPTIFEDERVN